MKFYTFRQAAVIAVITISSSVIAEFRIWEDQSGNIWEAKFVTMNGGNVVLIDQSGKKSVYSPEQLSEADIAYLEKVLPPRLSLSVSKKTERANTANSEYVRCRATIKKTDTRSYEGELTGVLVMISEESRTGAISKAGATKEFSFVLPEKHGVSVDFESDPVKLMKSSANSGRVYAGYVLVVWDRFGNVIAKEANRETFLEKAERIARPKNRI